MKFNKWTVGLAAAGIVTVPSLIQAQTNLVQTVAAGTSLTGYVDVAAQWNPGTGNGNTPNYAFSHTGVGNTPSTSKADGFNLNVVDIALDKPLDESPWAAGYHVELEFGPDAAALGTDSSYGTGGGDFAVRQAYVTLRTPVGNGIDWKAGVFDTIIGYESTSGPNNPNYTRSYGYTAEPTTHEGLLGTYKLCDAASVTAGVANTFGPIIGSRDTNPGSEGSKTYMAAANLTAPKSWGWLADSSATLGFINGFSSAVPQAFNANGNLTHYYAGFTLSTPVTGLKAGFAVDARHPHNASKPEDTWIYGFYTDYQATEKLSFHGRAEYVDDRAGLFSPVGAPPGKGARLFEFTATAQYDLWKNVLSRAEIRWDHASSGPLYGGTANAPTLRNAVLLAANVVYKF
jgi:hypothetical protein